MIHCPVADVTLRARSVASARLVVLVPLSSSVPLVKTRTCDLPCETHRVRVQGKRNSFIGITARIKLCEHAVYSMFWFEAGSGETDLSFNIMATVTICSDFGAQRIKCATVPIFSPSICHEVMGPDAMILVF